MATEAAAPRAISDVEVLMMNYSKSRLSIESVGCEDVGQTFQGEWGLI